MSMQVRLLLLGFLLVMVGIAVFATPWWVPAVSDARPQPEAYRRAGQVGGFLIGIGIPVMLLSVLKRKK